MKNCESCGVSFGCGLEETQVYCWCMDLRASSGIPAKFKDCLCKDCLENFVPSSPKEGEDFYFDENGLMVFTATYHLKRGTCCKSGCRNCPYDGKL